MDFGCGKYSKYKRISGIYLGFDVEPEIVSWLKHKNCFFDFWNENKKFDVVVAQSVLEHIDLKERLKFFGRVKALMTKKSVLVLVYPNPVGFNLLEYWKDGTHLLPLHWDLTEKQLKEFGFSVESFLVGVSIYPLTKLMRIIDCVLLGFPIQHTVIHFARLK